MTPTNLRLANGMLEVDFCPDHGGEIRFLGAPGGRNVLFYRDSESPLRAGRSATYGSSQADWLSEYRGGWQELFPNAGAECEVFGVPLPFHGEVSRAAWEVVEEGEMFAVLRTPARLPLLLERRMTLTPDRPVLQIEEVVTNQSDLQVPFLWGHHPAFEAVPGARIDIASATAHVAEGYDPPLNDLLVGADGSWPTVPDKSGGHVDLRRVPDAATERVVFLRDLSHGWAGVRSPGDGIGIGLAWDLQAFPHAWMWTEIGGTDFPWYGRSRIVAIEPATSWPSDGLAAALARGQAHLIPGGGSHHAWLTVSLFEADEVPVTAVERDGAVARAGRGG